MMWDEWDKVARQSGRIHSKYRSSDRCNYKIGIYTNKIHVYENDVFGVAIDNTSRKHSLTKKFHMADVVENMVEYPRIN